MKSHNIVHEKYIIAIIHYDKWVVNSILSINLLSYHVFFKKKINANEVNIKEVSPLTNPWTESIEESFGKQHILNQ